MRTLWLEAFLLENALGNAAILWAGARLFGWPARGLRIVLSACLGAVYAAVEAYAGGILATPWAKLIAAVGMVLVAYPRCKVKALALRVGVFYAMTFLLGGGAIALAYLTGWEGAAAIISAIALCLMMVEQLTRAWKRRTGQRLVRLCIEVEAGCSTTLTALIDTGASVVEPLSGAPVLMVENNALHLPQALSQALACPQDHPAMAARFHIRMVPYRPLGQSAHIAAAFRPDVVRIDGVNCPGVYIAPVEDVFSHAGEYRALASPALLAFAGLGEGAA